MTAVDYSFARPTVAQLKAAEVTLVLRYVGPTSWGKTITQAEYNALVAAGFTVELVFEESTNDSAGGFAAGVANAHVALEWAPAGYSGPIYFACDESLEGPALALAVQYIAGASSVLGPTRTGDYGEGDLLEATAAAGTADHHWQSASSSFPGSSSTTSVTDVQQGGAGPVAGTDADRIVAIVTSPVTTPTSPSTTEPEAAVPVSPVISINPGQADVFQVSDGTLWHKFRMPGASSWDNEAIAGPLPGSKSGAIVTLAAEPPQVVMLDGQCMVTCEDTNQRVWFFSQTVGAITWGVNELP